MDIVLNLIQGDSIIKMPPSLVKKILKTKDLPQNPSADLTEFFSKYPRKLGNQYVRGYKQKRKLKESNTIKSSDLF